MGANLSHCVLAFQKSSVPYGKHEERKIADNRYYLQITEC